MKLKKQYVLLCVFSLLLSNSVLADDLEHIHLDLNPLESPEAPEQAISEENVRACGAVLLQYFKSISSGLFPLGVSVMGTYEAYQAEDSLKKLLNHDLTNTTCTGKGLGCVEAKNAIQRNLGAHHSQMKFITFSSGMATLGSIGTALCTLSKFPAESIHLTNSFSLVFHLVSVFVASQQYAPIWQNWFEHSSALPRIAESSFDNLFWNTFSASALSLVGVGISAAKYFYYRRFVP